MSALGGSIYGTAAFVVKFLGAQFTQAKPGTKPAHPTEEQE